MDELSYEEQLNYYRPLLGREAEKTAQYQHALAVCNSLSDWCAKTRIIAQNLMSKDARYYILYGVGRRLMMIFYAYKEIVFTVHPERNKPLSHDEQLKLSVVLPINSPAVTHKIATSHTGKSL